MYFSEKNESKNVLDKVLDVVGLSESVEAKSLSEKKEVPKVDTEKVTVVDYGSLDLGYGFKEEKEEKGNKKSKVKNIDVFDNDKDRNLGFVVDKLFEGKLNDSLESLGWKNKGSSFFSVNWHDIAEMYDGKSLDWKDGLYDRYGTWRNKSHAKKIVEIVKGNIDKFKRFLDYVKALGDDWIIGIKQLYMWRMTDLDRSKIEEEKVKLDDKRSIKKIFALFGDIDVNGKIENNFGGGYVEKIELGDLGSLTGRQIVESISDALYFAEKKYPGEGEKKVVQNMIKMIESQVDKNSDLYQKLKSVKDVEDLKDLLFDDEYKFIIIPLFQNTALEWFGGVNDPSGLVNFLVNGEFLDLSKFLNEGKDKTIDYKKFEASDVNEKDFKKLQEAFSNIDEKTLEKINGNLNLGEKDPELLKSFWGKLFYKILGDVKLFYGLLDVSRENAGEIARLLGMQTAEVLAVLNDKDIQKHVLEGKTLTILLAGLKFFVLGLGVGGRYEKELNIGKFGFMNEFEVGAGVGINGVSAGVYEALLLYANKKRIITSSLDDIFKGKKAIYVGPEGEIRAGISWKNGLGGGAFARTGIKLEVRREIAVRDWLIAFEDKISNIDKQNLSNDSFPGDIQNDKFGKNNKDYLEGFWKDWKSYRENIKEQNGDLEQRYKIFVDSYVRDLSNHLYIALHKNKELELSGGISMGLFKGKKKPGLVSQVTTGSKENSGVYGESGQGLDFNFGKGYYGTAGFRRLMAYQIENGTSRLLTEYFSVNGIGAIKGFYSKEDLERFGVKVEEEKDDNGSEYLKISKGDNVNLYSACDENSECDKFTFGKINRADGYVLVIVGYNSKAGLDMNNLKSVEKLSILKQSKYTVDFINSDIVTADVFGKDEKEVEKFISNTLKDDVDGISFNSSVAAGNLGVDILDFLPEDSNIKNGTISYKKYIDTEGKVRLKVEYNKADPSGKLKIEYLDLTKKVEFKELENKINSLQANLAEEVIEKNSDGIAVFKSENYIDSNLKGKEVTYSDDFKIVLDSAGNIKKVERISGSELDGKLHVELVTLGIGNVNLNLLDFESNDKLKNYLDLDKLIDEYNPSLIELENKNIGIYGSFMEDLRLGDYNNAWTELLSLLSLDSNLSSLKDELLKINDNEEKLFVMDRIKNILAQEPAYRNWNAESFESVRGSTFESVEWINGDTGIPGISVKDRNSLLENGISRNFESADKRIDNTIFGAFTAYYRRVDTSLGGHQKARGYAPSGNFNLSILGGKNNVIEKKDQKDQIDLLLNNLEKYPNEQEFIVDYFKKVIKNHLETNGDNCSSSCRVDKLNWTNIKKLINDGSVDLGDGRKIEADIGTVFFLLGDCANESLGFRLNKLSITVDKKNQIDIPLEGISNEKDKPSGINGAVGSYNITNEYIVKGVRRSIGGSYNGGENIKPGILSYVTTGDLFSFDRYSKKD